MVTNNIRICYLDKNRPLLFIKFSSESVDLLYKGKAMLVVCQNGAFPRHRQKFEKQEMHPSGGTLSSH